MSELPFLDQYDGQTTAELIAMASTHRIDSLVLAFEQALDQRGAPYSTAERVVLAIEALEREVNNGGYGQFFENTAKYADFVVEARAAINCTQQAVIARRAIRALGLRGPIDRERAQAVLAKEDEARDDALDACDTAYDACDEDIAGQLFRYIEAHRTEIRLP